MSINKTKVHQFGGRSCRGNSCSHGRVWVIALARGQQQRGRPLYRGLDEPLAQLRGAALETGRGHEAGSRDGAQGSVEEQVDERAAARGLGGATSEKSGESTQH